MADGDWNVICAFSGFKAKASECVKTWDGQYVLRRFAGSETQRHPQDMPARPRPQRPLPWTQPEATDVFLSPGDVTQDDL